jgi:hypothetical protein
MSDGELRAIVEPLSAVKPLERAAQPMPVEEAETFPSGA